MALRVPRSRNLQFQFKYLHWKFLSLLAKEVSESECCVAEMNPLQAYLLMDIFPAMNATHRWVPPWIRELGLCLWSTPHFNYMPFLGISLTLKDYCPGFCIQLLCSKLFLSVMQSLMSDPEMHPPDIPLPNRDKLPGLTVQSPNSSLNWAFGQRRNDS